MDTVGVDMRCGSAGRVDETAYGLDCIRWLSLAIAASLVSCGDGPLPLENYSVVDSAPRPVPEAPCADRNPLRNPYFGDGQVHTSVSSDAWMFDVRLQPDDAYRYAFGGTVRLPPNDAQGRPTREVRIDRPLDFAAVTDHAEFLAEGDLCTDPSAQGYDGSFCKAFRKGEGRTPQLVFQIMSPVTFRDDAVCGSDGERCRVAAQSNWQRTIKAAEAWNDTSERCERTTFVAYEYSSFRLGSNLHRNVIFKNEVVPRQPVSYLDAHREWELWELLAKGCKRTESGCDVLAIPHNSNISNGRMFAVDYPGASSDEEQAARAKLRIEMEPIIEIMQHKGDSECRNGLPGVLDSEDELCDFERFENSAFMSTAGSIDPGECYSGPFADSVPHLGPNCLSRLSYARYALTEGLSEEARIGVNPFKFGLIGATDSHSTYATGEENNFQGKFSIDSTPEARRDLNILPGTENMWAVSAAGFAGVWAKENTRQSLYEAFKRKEVYATTGPRIAVRFFGGFSFKSKDAKAKDLAKVGYKKGVPMGGDLTDAPQNKAPSFLIHAVKDPVEGNLDRMQIVKGWLNADGTTGEKVFDVVWSGDRKKDANGKVPAVGNTVNLKTGAYTNTIGTAQLAAMWTDPEFNPAQRAFYYARVLQIPTPRYSLLDAIALQMDVKKTGHPATIQERAYSSPIWYTPK